MKIFYASLAFCLCGLAASAQLNSDTAQSSRVKTTIYDDRISRSDDHLHPRFTNLANPSGQGYEMDGAVYRSEAIVNRHVTNINDLIR